MFTNNLPEIIAVEKTSTEAVNILVKSYCNSNILYKPAAMRIGIANSIDVSTALNGL